MLMEVDDPEFGRIRLAPRVLRPFEEISSVEAALDDAIYRHFRGIWQSRYPVRCPEALTTWEPLVALGLVTLSVPVWAVARTPAGVEIMRVLREEPENPVYLPGRQFYDGGYTCRDVCDWSGSEVRPDIWRLPGYGCRFPECRGEHCGLCCQFQARDPDDFANCINNCC
jgi:hypothetical protein